MEPSARKCRILRSGVSGGYWERIDMLQWKNPRLIAVLMVAGSLAASFGSWGWELLSWGW
jgi:hypothetical protein